MRTGDLPLPRLRLGRSRKPGEAGARLAQASCAPGEVATRELAGSFGIALAARDQIRTPARGPLQSLRAAPLADLLMVAAQQHVGHAHPAKLFRTRVVRIFPQAVAERLLFQRGGIAE